jgi:hypothetical protein
MESLTTEDLNLLKEVLKNRVDELLSLRNRLAEYDSELINQFDQIELDLNKLNNLEGEERAVLKNKLLFDRKQFAERITAITADLTVKLEDYRNDFEKFSQERVRLDLDCPRDLKTTLETLLQIYKEHIDVFAGMEIIFKNYTTTLEEKTAKVIS